MLLLLLLFRLSILSVGPPAANAEVHSLVASWQERLHLQDWWITPIIVQQGALDEGAQADIEPNAETKSAVIRIMRLEDSDLPRRMAVADQEVSVIHELVHLEHFAHPGAVSWGDEGAVISETCALLRRYHRRLAFEVCECGSFQVPVR